MDEYVIVDLQCKRLPCPFARDDGVCFASSCLKNGYKSEEEFWHWWEETVKKVLKVINDIGMI